MRLANMSNRAVLVTAAGAVDIGVASAGRFGPGMEAVLQDWDAFRDWAAGADFSAAIPIDAAALGPVVPRPTQIFAVGLNYRAHALESGLAIPEVPLVFTKFASSLAPPVGELSLPTRAVDWEVEVAIVIGKAAVGVNADAAWSHVAGLTAAQDYSARDVQLAGGSAPQFSLGKSFPGFLPLGPYLVTPDEFEDPDDIRLRCEVNGVVVQDSTTSDLIFPVSVLVSYLSHIVTLMPGDLILTGTPSGVAFGMSEPRYLDEGSIVRTTVEGVGELYQTCVLSHPMFDARTIIESVPS